MEFVASEQEVRDMLAKSDRKDYLTFVSRVVNTTHQSPRMDKLPFDLVQRGPNATLQVTASPGEQVNVQTILYAAGNDVGNISVTFDEALLSLGFSCLQTNST